VHEPMKVRPVASRIRVEEVMRELPEAPWMSGGRSRREGVEEQRRHRCSYGSYASELARRRWLAVR
jgi:hypothetical protein